MVGPGGKIAVVAAVGLAALGVGLSYAAAQNAVSFKGKTITLLIGSDPGGGTDASGRLIALHLRKYLPGEPNIVVQNVPGASGITALNYFVHRTQPDGLTAAVGSISTIDPVIFHNANAQYDPRTFRFAGGFGRGGSVIFVNKAAEARLYDKSAKPVIIGSVQAVPRPAIQPALWCMEFLGWNATWVNGYRGTSEVMLALDRGEVDMTSTASIFQIQDRLKSGQLKLVTQTGSLEGGKIVGRAEFGNAPLFPDLIKDKINDPIARTAFDLWTAMNGGDKWLGLAPATPDGILTTYRDAFAKLAVDQVFLEQGERISEGFAPMSARDVEFVVQTLADTPTEAVEYTKSLMRKQGVRIQ
jgi:tripartite-type tricarboxylate transporter receptor subunit TctC